MKFFELCEALEAAKIEEEAAKQKRIDAENALLPFLAEKDEGSVTHRADGWKVTVTYGMNRSVDQAAVDAVRAAMPVALFENAFRPKWDLSITGLRYLQNNEPETYAIAAQAITAKPAKPSVCLERVEALGRAA